jgi:hypothetical protein
MYRTIFALSVLAAVGCSSSPSSSSTAEVESACSDLAQARCDQLAACSSTVIQTRYGDEMTCLSLQKESCVNGLMAPSNGNNPTHTEACSQAIATWDCSSYIDNVGQPLACQQQTGALAVGAACVVAGQCQTGFCAVLPGSECGVCAAAPTAGASCADLTTCGPGMTCTSDTKTCVVFGGANSACGTGAPCGAGLACVGANATTNTRGTCQVEQTQIGATCDPALKTGTGCDRNAGLVCNSTSKTCQTATISPAGGQCGTVNHQPALCSAGTCTGASGATPGTCVANAGEGESCDTANGPACLAGARCIVASGTTAGTCELNDSTMCK